MAQIRARRYSIATVLNVLAPAAKDESSLTMEMDWFLVGVVGYKFGDNTM